MRRAVFVDRDGTLNVDLVRSVDVSRLQLMPGAKEAVALWNAQGWPVVVVTNQSGIGRGLYTAREMEAFHEAIARRIAPARIDAWYHCPHVPGEGCACRKPGTRMLERASAELGLDPRASFMVGDSWMDVGAGAAAGARTVLVPSRERDYERECVEGLGRLVRPDHVARDLLDAARWSVEASRGRY